MGRKRIKTFILRINITVQKVFIIDTQLMAEESTCSDTTKCDTHLPCMIQTNLEGALASFNQVVEMEQEKA
ncbi:hypothetical protein Fmac_001683 [Flemingia macrophylla]|uniref:Uncharacterized protein n=1 Tax=Flemingia macrophylla TaxID=520843 RepID=A0ABD1NHT1_9FABA